MAFGSLKDRISLSEPLVMLIPYEPAYIKLKVYFE